MGTVGTMVTPLGTSLGTSLGTGGARCLLGLVLLGAPGLAAGALAEPELCYVLDAVLFLYSLILTGLYVHLRFATRKWRRAARRPQNNPKIPPKFRFRFLFPGRRRKRAVYAGLSSEHQETYETLQMKRS
ncbi:high affinity immunoglobulin epsilon receptor subunit gamma [Agelaius phoeniceus]|uniref:high affinity immunoglobulin epsilon receptor subunit gamma n=1 Tax=Agelaius phoeniceus TaxID=39638 RepID=UPI004054EDDD